jgi:uncharacterized membrane protein
VDLDVVYVATSHLVGLLVCVLSIPVLLVLVWSLDRAAVCLVCLSARGRAREDEIDRDEVR